MRFRTWWNKLRGWWQRVWSGIRPGPETRKGVFWASSVTAAGGAVIAGTYLHSGFGHGIDLAVAFGVAALGIPLFALVLALLLTILRKLPRLLAGMVAGVAVYISLFWPPMGIVLVLVETILGATLATILIGHFRDASRGKKIITVVLCAAAIAANVGLFVFFATDGTGKDMMRLAQNGSPEPSPLAAPNPAERGPYGVKNLTYGPGTDIRRQEYGKSVAIHTKTVDTSLFFKDFKGWKAKLRKRYWGFGVDQLPLNARVWYPDGAGPFPLALIVHGNHNMADFSDPGYEYLGELLASRGFILASVDENFINGGPIPGMEKEQAVRGWILLEHLKLWRAWNTTPGNPFFGKVDVENVALMGHSRGGEAAATAALFNKMSYYPDDANIRFDYGFPIKSIVAIAPADGQYKPAGQWRALENVNYFTIQGANDADVSSFSGSHQWDRVRYTQNGPWFKAELYIYRANHGQFNTVWGRTDAGAPLSWYLNLKPLLSGDDQRRIGKTYISAFLEATLHNRREYLPMFRDYRTIRTQLPDTLYMNRYLDASYKVISDFSEDPDVTTTTVPGGRIQGENLSIWREGRIPFRRGNRDYNGVFLGWNREKTDKIASYSISLPDGLAGPRSVLVLSLAVTDENAPVLGKVEDDKDKKKEKDENKKPEPTDFTVELQTKDGATAQAPLSRFGILPPPFKVRFTKLAALDDYAYNKPSEPAFQTIEMPIAAFGIDGTKLKTIRLRFDRTPARVVILSQVGLSLRD